MARESDIPICRTADRTSLGTEDAPVLRSGWAFDRGQDADVRRKLRKWGFDFLEQESYMVV